MATALIIDDEFHARENLLMMLAEYCPDIQVVDTAGTVGEGKRKIELWKPQLVFADIRMPSGTEGLELIESFPQGTFQVILVTAFRHYAESALEKLGLKPEQLVLKPIDSDELVLAVRTALARL